MTALRYLNAASAAFAVSVAFGACAVAFATPSLARAAPPATASASVVINGTFVKLSGKTIVYRSSKGRFTATWIGTRRYRLGGKINGRRLSGTFRTRQAGGGRYMARGSGKLGGRRVTIRGEGPNNLKTARLVLR